MNERGPDRNHLFDIVGRSTETTCVPCSFNLGFDFLADESSALSGTVSAYLNNMLLSTINLVGDGNGNTSEFLSLAALGGIDRLVLDPSSDPAGLGYDNFTYDVSAVPVPAALWLFGTAMIGLVGLNKRRKAA